MQYLCEELVRMAGPEGEILVGLVLGALALWKHVQARRALQAKQEAMMQKREAVVELETLKRSLPPQKPSTPTEEP